MGFRSKLGWAVAAVLAAALVYGGDDKSSSPPKSIERDAASEPAKETVHPRHDAVRTKSAPLPFAPRPTEDVVSVAPEQPPIIVERTEVYTTAKVRVRSAPSTKSSALRMIEKGVRLVAHGSRDGWHKVSYEGGEGWIRSDYLTDRLPEIVRAPDPPPAAIISRPTRRAAEPVRAAEAGEPIRQAVTGSCDCPYDRMRNGRRCGGNSAWSKPGGRQPVCFVGD